MMYEVPMKWQERGSLPVESESLEEAAAYALGEDSPLPKVREYVPGSLELDIPALYATARAKYPDSDADFFERLYQEQEKENKGGGNGGNV